MGLIKFNLTEDHIKVVKHMDWNNYPFENKNAKYDTIGLILYGKEDFPLPKFYNDNPDEFLEHKELWSEEHKTYMDKINNELMMALSVMLQTGIFEAGEYKTKHYLINWKKK